ncbi:hypothetical protein [Anaeromyxobacter sp. PSR-1]|uniref:hypothetical protein n=1 Tax=unclassified Anaeromyxobacter TaxID=2620896 RepID=UPI0005DDDB3F|nr:hypothetical protein [Anaeromyxobacter sp. PSR-1]GAO02019.1 hypothetical protein PSR1_00886 [Anaeromyxobacter sp. PSR-1]
MSDHVEHAHGVRSEEDRIDTGKIIAVGVAALVVFFIGSYAAIAYLQDLRASREGPPIPPEIGQNKIGMVEQQLFELSVRGERDRTARRQRLASYGWVDRGAGVVHLPIDRAMDLVAQGIRPMPAPPVEPVPSQAPDLGPGPGGQP